jgi:hypothetical protein
MSFEVKGLQNKNAQFIEKVEEIRSRCSGAFLSKHCKRLSKRALQTCDKAS